MNFYAITSRGDLGEFLVKLDPRKVNVQSGTIKHIAARLHRGEYLLDFGVRSPEIGDLPETIIVDESELREFYAWCATFVTSLRPISAFTAVKGSRAASLQPDFLAPSDQVIGGMLGLVLIEGLLQSKVRGRVPDLIIPTCSRTLSAVFLQLAMNGCSFSDIADSATEWFLVRDYLGAPKLSFDSERVSDVWSWIFRAIGQGQNVDIRTVLHYATVDAESSRFFKNAETLFGSANGSLHLRTREDQIRNFDRMVDHIITHGMQTNLGVAAYAGHYLATISNGDFALWPTSLDQVNLETLPLWFAFFCGLHDNSNILSFAKSSTRRILSLIMKRTVVDVDAQDLLSGSGRSANGGPPFDFPLLNQHELVVRLRGPAIASFTIRDHRDFGSASRGAEQSHVKRIEQALRMLAEIDQQLRPIISVPVVEKAVPGTLFASDWSSLQTGSPTKKPSRTPASKRSGKRL